MMYMTPTEAEARLAERYGIQSTDDEEVAIFIGDVMQASEDLRDQAPFVEGVDLDSPPDALLDWVALRSYDLASYETPISSQSIGDLSVSYRDGLTRTQRRLQRLLRPYLAVRGRVS